MSSDEAATLRMRRSNVDPTPATAASATQQSVSASTPAPAPASAAEQKRPAAAVSVPVPAAPPHFRALPPLTASLPPLRTVLLVSLLALALRVALLLSPLSAALRGRVELAGPTTAVARLHEGFHAASAAALSGSAAAGSPFAGGVLHHSPLYAAPFHFARALSTLLRRFEAGNAASTHLAAAPAPALATLPTVPLAGPGAALPLLPYLATVFAFELALALALAALTGYYAARPVPVPASVRAFAACAQDWDGDNQRNTAPDTTICAKAGTSAAADLAASAQSRSVGADSVDSESELRLVAPPPWLPSLVFALPLLNPFSVLAAAAVSTAVVPHALLALAALAASRARPRVAALLAALTTLLEPSLWVAAPALALVARALAAAAPLRRAAAADSAALARARARAAVLAFAAVYCAALALGALLCCALTTPVAAAAAALPAPAPGEPLWLTAARWLLQRLGWADGAWGALLVAGDATPSIGLWWYFALQVFPRFRGFFTAVFHGHAAVYAAMLAARLPRWPLFALWASAAAASLFKPYPTVVDTAVALCGAVVHLPLLAHRARRPHALLFALAQSACVGAFMWSLWTERAAGNANFFFFQTVLFSFVTALFVIEQVSAVRRLQSIPPGAVALVNAAAAAEQATDVGKGKGRGKAEGEGK